MVFKNTINKRKVRFIEMSEWVKVIITCENGRVIKLDPEVWNETTVINRLEKKGEKIISIKHISRWGQYAEG